MPGYDVEFIAIDTKSACRLELDDAITQLAGHLTSPLAFFLRRQAA